MNEKLIKLEALAKQVKDSYDDFVIGLRADLSDEPDNLDKMIKYMENNPNANTSEIIEYLNDLEGIDTSALPIIDEERVA